MAVVFKKKAAPAPGQKVPQEDASLLAELGLLPPPPQPTPKPESESGRPREPLCAICGRPQPTTPPQGDLAAAVRTDVSLSFEPGDSVRVTNRIHPFIDSYRAGDTGVVKSCHKAGRTPASRYTVVEVRLDKPRQARHDTVWLQLWELEAVCR